MLNIPDAIKTLYQQDSVRKNFRVKFPNGEMPDITNSNVLTESVTFTESLCSQQYLKFGLTEASEIQFETIGIGNMLGMTIECYSEIDTTSLTAAQIADIQAMTGLDGELVLAADSDLTNFDGTTWGFFRVPYGTFVVDECPRNHGAMTHRRVTAYSERIEDGTILSTMYKTLLNQDLPAKTFTVTEGFLLANMWQGLTEEEFSQKGTVNDNVRSGGTWQQSFNFTMQKEVEPSGSVPEYEWIITVESTITGPAFSIPYESDTSPYPLVGASDINIMSIKGAMTSKAALKTEVIQSLKSIIEDDYSIDLTGIEYSYYDGFETVTGTFTSNDEAYDIIFNNCFYIYPSVVGIAQYIYYWELQSDEENMIYRPADFQNLLSTSSAALDINVPHTSTASITVDLPQISSYDTRDITPTNEIIDTSLIEAYYLTDVNESWSIPFTCKVKGSPSIKRNGRQLYQYGEVLKVKDMLQGMVELSGHFLMMQRDGKYGAVSLSSPDTESIERSEYSELWWDEYDVDPIGTIIYTFLDQDADEESTVTYDFGDGESVYEMKDNFILKNLSSASMSTINTLLDTYFIPNITGVNFTPIELDMIGLPYIEDGDYLTVTAEDGVEVSSYVLRHTIKGIQALQDSVESTNGELLTSEEVED
ncbi:MAG: hypothetical protein IJ680_06825 [Paludibacteraceae bacterium]|nr:hypothetical protein [Paludibacteraceae bacterium]